MSFTDVLSKRMEDIEAPKPLPKGTYLAIVDGPFVEVTSTQKGTPGVEFTFRLVQPISVADEAALAEAGGCAGRTVRHRFWIAAGDSDNKSAGFMLNTFLRDHLDIDPTGKTLAEGLAEAPGRQLAVSLTQILTKGNEPRIIHVVDGTAKV